MSLRQPDMPISRPESQRNGGMDILRMLAIVAVVQCHAVGHLAPSDPLRQISGLGGKGVDLFFALSGWLLGRQLLRELAATGRIDARRFWARRWLRTLPAYFAMLAFTYAWQSLRTGRSPDWTFLYFGQTYLSDMPYFGISWSLCVEEHFYLLIPLALVLLNWSWGAAALSLLLLLPQAFRLADWFGNEYQSHVRFDQCGTGVLLAWVESRRPRAWGWLCRNAGPVAIAGSAAALWNLFTRTQPGRGYDDLPMLAWSAVAVSWILWVNASEFGKVGLRFRASRFLADRAYSLYLTHVEAIVIVRRLDTSGGLPLAATLVLTWALALAFAEILYRCVEKPAMQARDRFSLTRPVESADRVRGPGPR